MRKKTLREWHTHTHKYKLQIQNTNTNILIPKSIMWKTCKNCDKTGEKVENGEQMKINTITTNFQKFISKIVAANFLQWHRTDARFYVGKLPLLVDFHLKESRNCFQFKKCLAEILLEVALASCVKVDR